MREKRSLFKMIFGRQPPKDTTGYTQLQMLNGYNPTFTLFGDEVYNSEVVRSTVDAIARNAAKLKPKHIRRVNGEIIPQSSQLERLLQVRPNPYMDAYTFYYKVITQLYMKNNSFIYIDINMSNGNVLGFYPILASNVQLFEYSNDIYCKFNFMNGKKITLPYADLIHLRRFFYSNDFWGESNDPALRPTLELTHTTKEGIVNAVKSSAFLRGLLKFQTMLKPEDLKEQRDRFVADYMNITNNGGIAALDSKAEYVPLDNDPKMVNKPQMDYAKESIYNYFGVSENIIKSNYNEEEWAAFYESTIEPIAIQMSLEFTYKLFTDREMGHGNEIIFEANRLQYASNTTKLKVVETLMPFGMLSINQGLEIFNLAPIDGGEKRLISLNYVDAEKANKYQLGEDDKDGEGGDEDGQGAKEGAAS